MALISSATAKGKEPIMANDTPEKLEEVTVTMPNGTVTTFQVNEKDRKDLEAIVQAGAKKAPPAKNKARSS